MARNIVICCDGTSNNVIGHSTNILKLYRILERNPDQITYYAPGIGSATDLRAKTIIGKWIARRLDMGIGYGIGEAACEIYHFLSSNYQQGDRIFLFGFSRGAYTVRSVAGMVQFLGLLRRDQAHLTKHAWAIYANDDQSLSTEERFGAGRRIAKIFSVRPKPKIHFLGAFDTVSSFGWLWNQRTLPHTASNPSIRHIRHAVAIDERRAMFRQNLFRQNDANESFEEYWFAGGHGDVGGGWPEVVSGLSRITLDWMVRSSSAEGLRFDQRVLDRFIGAGQDATPAQVAVNDALTGPWWLIEAMPRKLWNPTKSKMSWSLPHRGRLRVISKDAQIHPSVHKLMQIDKSYRPKNLIRSGLAD